MHLTLTIDFWSILAVAVGAYVLAGFIIMACALCVPDPHDQPYTKPTPAWVNVVAFIMAWIAWPWLVFGKDKTDVQY